MSRATLEPVQTAYSLEDLKAMDTPALRAELAAALGHTARQLVRLAAIWAELESRGEDLSALRTGIGTYLPGIAAGAVAAEAVVAFAGQKSLLRAVTSLPPDEQRRLAAGGTVPMAVTSEDGYTHRMVSLATLPSRAIYQVFGDRCVRSVPAQIAILSAAPTPWRGDGKPVRRGRITVDRKNGIVRVGRAVAQLADVVAAMKAAGVHV